MKIVTFQRKSFHRRRMLTIAFGWVQRVVVALSAAPVLSRCVLILKDVADLRLETFLPARVVSQAHNRRLRLSSD